MPEGLHLDERNLPDYLRRLGLAGGGETIRVEPAGDGNINWVRRVRTRHGSFVVKQARAALERFPQYHASTERIACEARWLELARAHDREGVCPGVLRFDAESHVLVLEDLGDAPRLDQALAAGGDARAAARRVARLLGAVHAATPDPALAARFPNDEMRRLHGDHIFRLPLRENDFPLPPPVRARAEALWRDAELVALADEAYRRYLEPDGALVHGDVQAANVLLPPRGAVLLDAEIAHVGDPAFDVGQLVAHLWLPAAARGAPERARAAVEAAFEAHGATAAPEPGLRRRALRYAAFELLRRSVGAARVPAVAAPEAALAVVDFALALTRNEAG
jgi:5-methylthioribose kinase